MAGGLFFAEVLGRGTAKAASSALGKVGAALEERAIIRQMGETVDANLKLYDEMNAPKGGVALDVGAERALLKSTAEGLANEVKKGPFKQSNAEAGPVLTVVRDRVSGELFDGQNLGAIPDKLHPLLQNRLDAYLAANGGNLNAVWGVPGSHSEIAALNQALLRREALGLPVKSLEEFSMYNVSLWNNRLGTPVPRCGNCQYLTDGVQVLSGK